MKPSYARLSLLMRSLDHQSREPGSCALSGSVLHDIKKVDAFHSVYFNANTHGHSI